MSVFDAMALNGGLPKMSQMYRQLFSLELKERRIFFVLMLVLKLFLITRRESSNQTLHIIDKLCVKHKFS